MANIKDPNGTRARRAALRRFLKGAAGSGAELPVDVLIKFALGEPVMHLTRRGRPSVHYPQPAEMREAAMFLLRLDRHVPYVDEKQRRQTGRRERAWVQRLEPSLTKSAHSMQSEAIDSADDRKSPVGYESGITVWESERKKRRAARS